MDEVTEEERQDNFKIYIQNIFYNTEEYDPTLYIILNSTDFIEAKSGLLFTTEESELFFTQGEYAIVLPRNKQNYKKISVLNRKLRPSHPESPESIRKKVKNNPQFKKTLAPLQWFTKEKLEQVKGRSIKQKAQKMHRPSDISAYVSELFYKPRESQPELCSMNEGRVFYDKKTGLKFEKRTSFTRENGELVLYLPIRKQNEISFFDDSEEQRERNFATLHGECSSQCIDIVWKFRPDALRKPVQDPDRPNETPTTQERRQPSRESTRRNRHSDSVYGEPERVSDYITFRGPRQRTEYYYSYSPYVTTTIIETDDDDSDSDDEVIIVEEDYPRPRGRYYYYY